MIFDLQLFKKLSIYLLFFWVITTTFVISEAATLAVVFFGLLVFYIASYNNRLLISFFVYILPLSSVIGTENNLFGLIGFNEVTQIGIVYYLILNRYKKHNHIPRIVQHLQRILIVIFIYHLIYTLKSIVFPNIYVLEHTSIFYFFKTIFKLSLNYIPLVILIRHIIVFNISRYIIPPLILSVLTIILSMPIAEFLTGIGFNTMQTEYSIGLNTNKIIRAAGFYGLGGDVNSAGLFIASVLGFIVTIKRAFINYRLLFSFLLFVFAFGIVFTASRTALISLVLIIIYMFFKTNVLSKQMFTLLSVGIIGSIVFYPVIESAFERFFMDSARAALDPNELGRVGKWLLYFNYFKSYPAAILFGYLKPINTILVPHNVLINLLYNGGLIVFLPFVYYLFNIIRWLFRARKSSLILIVIIPFIGVLMTVNTPNSGNLIWLMVAIEYYILINIFGKGSSVKTNQPQYI